MHFTNQRTVTMIGWQMYEALFTFDADYATVPMLAQAHEVSEDGLTHTITLRQGVQFHTGGEMTATDVVASFNRWAPVSNLGQAISEFLVGMEEVDPYTVTITLTDPLVALPSMMARQAQGLSIHPKAVIDAAGENPMTDEHYIGTGPYQFVERQADRFTLFRRFDGYVGVEGPPSGYAGSKAAYLDEIEFIPVPDEAARLAGLQSGEYHYLEEIIPDQIEAVGDDPAVNIQILPPRSYGIIVLNNAGGLMANVGLRQAVQAAIAVVPSGLATHGEGYFEPGPGIMLPQTAWHSEVSAELYDQGDPEKARELATAAGYDGTPLRVLCTQEDLGDYNAAVVAQQQLEEAGFTIELEVSDEATLEENIEDDNRWDVTTNAYVFRPDPVLIPAVRRVARSMASGARTRRPRSWHQAPDRAHLRSGRFAAFEDLQRLWYRDAPAIKLVNNYGVAPLSVQRQGCRSRQPISRSSRSSCNTWLEEG